LSDEDTPLQKWLRLLFSAVGLSGSEPTPAAPDAAVVMAAVDNRATEEAMVMGSAEEATEKAAANKEAADKSIVDEATVKGAVVGAPGDSPAPGQVPSLVAGTKRAVAPSGSSTLAK
jgi:hypothetical protein